MCRPKKLKMSVGLPSKENDSAVQDATHSDRPNQDILKKILNRFL